MRNGYVRRQTGSIVRGAGCWQVGNIPEANGQAATLCPGDTLSFTSRPIRRLPINKCDPMTTPSPDQLRTYHEQGYLILRQVFSPERMKTLRTAFERLIERADL